MTDLTTRPALGQSFFRFRGDFFQFELHLPGEWAGQAFLRTNISHGQRRFRSIVAQVEQDTHPLPEDWFDVEMERSGNDRFSLTLPLLEVGSFEAKPFFLPQGDREPLWPEGENWRISIAPAMYRSWNSIYCAFVRQFGATKDAATSAGFWDESVADEWERQGFSVIPPSGSFRDLIGELDHIFNDLNCRILHLLPVHPTPAVFGKMGRFGSPYASQDFFAVDPHLAEFDRSATPLDQFLELVDAVHARGGRLILDMALNHTGWASKIHETHPEWLKRDPEGNIHRPGAWGVTWEDLTELDHTQKSLWPYLYSVLETWCARGVDGFRCDAGYMIPEPAWTYIVAKIRQSYPDTLFLLEGLGGKLEVTERLLSFSNLNFAYSELFQVEKADDVTSYLEYSSRVSQASGLMVHYCETHDNNRLAAVSKNYARMRVALCALFSQCGGFGFANGVEWFAAEKIDVHGASALNWGSPDNQVTEISRINSIFRDHPCFWESATVDMLSGVNPELVAGIRSSDQSAVLVLVNLDCHHEKRAHFASQILPDHFQTAEVWFDLLADQKHAPHFDEDGSIWMSVNPGQAMCLSPDPWKPDASSDHLGVENRGVLAMDLLARKHALVQLGGMDRHALSTDLAKNPHEFCAKLGDVCTWSYPHDLDRQVMLGLDGILLVRAPFPFRARFCGVQHDSVAAEDGSQFTAFTVDQDIPCITVNDLEMQVFEPSGPRRLGASIVCLSTRHVVDERVLRHVPATRRFLDTNGRGGMLRTNLSWGRLTSRYDALLAANLHARVPEDRFISWRRCRMWTRFHGHSIALDETCTGRVCVGDRLHTTFDVPLGTGRWMKLHVTLCMIPDENATLMTFSRERQQDPALLADTEAVTVIVRPDLEDRYFHDATKAFTGPEENWPRACSTPDPRTLEFAPQQGRRLILRASSGHFRSEPGWVYNVTQEEEANRGFDPNTDLFSPGYFSLTLLGGEEATLLGQMISGSDEPISEQKAIRLAASQEPDTDQGGQTHPYRILWHHPFPVLTRDDSFETRLKNGMRHFVVKRDEGKTVIAGYPWFLDWGRDTLIASRGLLAAGWVEETSQILKQLARFAHRGTLPNMIRGEDARNRDTSDAPLWFFVACEDVCRIRGNLDFLAEDAGGKTMGQALVTLAGEILDGTPNGIAVDRESGFVFSPPHFTWMDTNHPAGTPRSGYPIEIQALWHRALGFLASFDKSYDWTGLGSKVQQNAEKLFWLEKDGYFSDCLHADASQSAREATPDDALRPNQLLGITLGLLTGSRARRAVRSCERLLVPGGIRSLADRPVQVPIPVRSADGSLLNDPMNPYWGTYLGDEDTRRKPAYHNGTAWTWQFPSFSEALFVLDGEKAKPLARAILGSCAIHLDSGCIGQIPEILDGNAPHSPRGCDAQAWSVTETYRVCRLLSEPGIDDPKEGQP